MGNIGNNTTWMNDKLNTRKIMVPLWKPISYWHSRVQTRIWTLELKHRSNKTVKTLHYMCFLFCYGLHSLTNFGSILSWSYLSAGKTYWWIDPATTWPLDRYISHTLLADLETYQVTNQSCLSTQNEAYMIRTQPFSDIVSFIDSF